MRKAIATVLLLAASPWFLASATLAQTLTKLPMLQTMRATEMWLAWETDSDPGAGTHFVDFGEGSVSEQTVASSETIEVDPSHFVHRAMLSGLAPATAYRYRVRSGAAQSPEFVFHTAPMPAGPSDPAAFRMAWVSDNQNQAGTSFAGVLARIAPHAVDFIGHAGDTVQNGSIVQEWHDDWYTPLASVGLGQTTPVLVARGNHDGESATAKTYHWLPNGGQYYSQRVGRVYFLYLDSNATNAATQMAFIETELASEAAQEADFRVAVFHIPGFTNLWCSPNFNGSAAVRSLWVPLFEQYGVDLVVNGHAHAYERGNLNGVNYTIVGGAGGLIDTIVPTEPWDHFDVALSVHHYVIMEVDGPRLIWTAYDLQDQIIDSFQLVAGSQVPSMGLAGRVLLILALATACGGARRSRTGP